ncbi:HEL232Wp [Eremothecium sinecaudum]|uniref:HEL232Wp n=1 Tax=Eremothecium sinecaudum TaxID=45286 RepID=A0A0X8HTA1_9SACH|nr:HEL232Wp [Eremothecium sinecaudum]AMD21049.1 HEL232Wp [Eremothecium sinecaudum]
MFRRLAYQWLRAYRQYPPIKSNGVSTINQPYFRYRKVGYLVPFGAAFYIYNLDEVPVTHRKRFLWVPRNLELMIGDYSYNCMLQETQGKLLPADHPLTVEATKILRRLLAAVKDRAYSEALYLDNLDWKVHIVNDYNLLPNAIIIPGGRVFIYGNMLKLCENQDGLATILSHELAHQVARHSAEQISKSTVYLAASIIFSWLTGFYIPNDWVDSLLKKPGSRAMETEADLMGIMIMSKACFNPQEAVRLWNRVHKFEKMSGQDTSFDFMSTHPASAKRVENMRKWLPKAQEVYGESCEPVNNLYNVFQTVFRRY